MFHLLFLILQILEHFEPFVLNTLLKSDSLERQFLQNQLNKLTSLNTNINPIFFIKDQRLFKNSFEDFNITITIKRWITSQHNVHDNSNTPNICFFSILSSYDLWRNVITSAQRYTKDVTLSKLFACSKIN